MTRNMNTGGSPSAPRLRRDSQAAGSAILRQVRGQVEPAFAFAVSYLRLLSEQFGLGALAVWFGREGIEHYLGTAPRDLEWHDDLAALLQVTPPLGPRGQSAFCALLRENSEGNQRCHACDARWIAHARATGRSWVYQCHAGLSEVIAPIQVNGKRVGEVMGGQIASSDDLPHGFEDVWQRIQDLPGLDRHALHRAFQEVHTVDRATLGALRLNLQAVARALGALVESVASLMSREALLGQVRSYAVRDFAWYALNEPDAPGEDVAARAKALGFTEMPSVAIVIVVDRAEAGVHAIGGGPAPSLPELFEAAQRIIDDMPDSMVCSIRPDELVVLMRPAHTRNLSLRVLRVHELAARLEQELELTCKAPLLVGVSDVSGPFESLARAYAEAHNDLGRKTRSLVGLHTESEASLPRIVALMEARLQELQRAVRYSDSQTVRHTVEKLLRLVAGCPNELGACRLSLFTHLVFSTLQAVQSHQGGVAAVEGVRDRYARAMHNLRTSADMAAWYHAHVTPVVDASTRGESSRSERIVAMACDMAMQRLSESISREDIARAVGLSGAHFGKLFRAQTGISFREYLRRLRVSRAQTLLLVPGKKVSEVAGEVGYSTMAAFSRSFEEVCGTSPCRYRNNPQAFSRIAVPRRERAG